MNVIEKGVQFIEHEISLGRGVVVNCAMGVSRSATIVIAYIMKKYDISFIEAYEKVLQKRPVISPNPLFKYVLKHMWM